MKLDILAFGAHPDDVELGCSGTLAKEVSLGKKVGIVDLTRGELGTRGSAAIRDAEAAAAAKILKVLDSSIAFARCHKTKIIHNSLSKVNSNFDNQFLKLFDF